MRDSLIGKISDLHLGVMSSNLTHCTKFKKIMKIFKFINSAMVLDLINFSLIITLLLLITVNAIFAPKTPELKESKIKNILKRPLCRISKRNLKILFKKVGPRKKNEHKNNIPRTLWKTKYKKTSPYLDDFDADFNKFKKKKVLFTQRQQRKLYKRRRRWY